MRCTGESYCEKNRDSIANRIETLQFYVTKYNKKINFTVDASKLEEN